MVIVLFDINERQNLYPLTQIRAVSALKCGIFSARERWEMISGLPVFVLTEPYLMCLYDPSPEDEYLWIDSSLWDESSLRSQILLLQTGEALEDEYGLIAGRVACDPLEFDYRHHFIVYVQCGKHIFTRKPGEGCDYRRGYKSATTGRHLARRGRDS